MRDTMPIPIISLPVVGAFLFVFAIVLGLLTTAKLFDKRNVNVAIAAVFGLFSAIYEPFVSGIQTYLPIAAGVLIIIFFFALVRKLFGGDKESDKRIDALPISIVLISLLIVLASQWDLVRGFLPAGLDAASVAWGIGIAAILIIFWAVYRHKETGGAPAGPGPVR